jgi:hypothetical protein
MVLVTVTVLAQPDDARIAMVAISAGAREIFMAPPRRSPRIELMRS